VKTIQIALDPKLLKATTLAAKHQKISRSALIRHVPKEHLTHRHIADLEEQDRRGYQANPQRIGEYLPWEQAASWPRPISGHAQLSPSQNTPSTLPHLS
jgi:hypothetical protein